MNFSKGLLLLCSLIALIAQLLIFKNIPGLNMTYFYILTTSSVLAYLFNLYFTYHIKYHASNDNKSNKDDDSSE